MSGLLLTLPLQLACQLINNEIIGQLNVTIVKDTTPLESETTRLSEGYTTFPDLGIAYKYYGNRLTWNGARKQCIAEGGRLAVIDSFKKIRYINSVKEKNVNLHVGIHRLFTNVEWIDVTTANPVAFIPWKPDVNLGAETGKCTMLLSDGSGLSPSNCTQKLPAVCEVKISKSSVDQLQFFPTTTNIPLIDRRFGV